MSMSTVDANKLLIPSAPRVMVDQASLPPPPPQYCALYKSPQQQYLPPPGHQYPVQPQAVPVGTVYVNLGQQQQLPQLQQSTRLRTTHVDSYWMHIVLACCVLLCFNLFFGIAAFALAFIARGTASRNEKSARALGYVSLAISIAGIITTGIIIAVVITSGGHQDSFISPPIQTVTAPNPSTKCVYLLAKTSCFEARRLACLTTVSPGGSDTTVCQCSSMEVYSGGYCYYNT